MNSLTGRKAIVTCLAYTLAFISGCSIAEDRTPTPSVARPPTERALPALIPSPTPNPTQTPQPTPTLTPSPLPTVEITFGERRAIEHGGFTYRLIEGYGKTYRLGLVVQSSNDQKVLLSLSGVVTKNPVSVEDGFESFLMNVSRDIEGFRWEIATSTKIGGRDGLAVDVEGFLFQEDMKGRFVYVKVSEFQFFTAMGLAPQERWESEGRIAFEGLLNEIEFFDATPVEDFCPVSVDKTFGYTKDNPVQVSDGILGDPSSARAGPRLEREYLDQLRGPDGQPVEYERLSSVGHGDTILDMYSVTYQGQSTKVILYLDMYNLDQWRIPLGFRCGD